MKLFSDPIIVLDTETTGFFHDSEVIEIGAVCIDEWGRERTTFSSLIRPNRIDGRAKQALKINKINPNSLRTAPSPETIMDCFTQWIERIPTSNGPVMCTAFNVPFDKRMLEKMGIHLRWGECIRTMTNNLMKKTGQQPRDVKGKAKAPSLEEACAYFSIPYPHDAHRALSDAKVSAQVAIEAIKKQRR